MRTLFLDITTSKTSAAFYCAKLFYSIMVIIVLLFTFICVVKLSSSLVLLINNMEGNGPLNVCDSGWFIIPRLCWTLFINWNIFKTRDIWGVCNMSSIVHCLTQWAKYNIISAQGQKRLLLDNNCNKPSWLRILQRKCAFLCNINL
jgi:hypothetical protein